MEQTRCAACGGDAGSGGVGYESDDGHLLCESCFYRAADAAETPRGRFAFLRAAAVVLKFFAFVALAGALFSAHSRYADNPLPAAGTALLGILVFLASMLLSEMLRLGISLDERVAHISRTLDRLAACEVSAAPPLRPQGQGAGEEFP